MFVDIALINTGLLQKNTRHIIGKAEFAKMKDGVVVVNTARGAVMDEAALVEALDRGKVFSAGLDVFEEEPKVHPGLLNNPNVMLVPHMGTWTEEVSDANDYISEAIRLTFSRLFLRWRSGLSRTFVLH